MIILCRIGYNRIYLLCGIISVRQSVRDFCTVSEQDMQNFMRATDPEIQGTRFIDSEKLRGKRSVPVRVVRRGPLYGVTGKFLRYGGRHYIAIEMPHSTALLKVSFTWCEIVVDQ